MGKILDQIVYVGRLDKLKGISVLLEAWREYEKTHNRGSLVICGSGPEEEWCQNYVSKNELKRVKLMGQVTNNKAKEIMAKSRALIFPTQLYEGFPMVIVEAFSVGTPVLCSNIGNVADIVVDGVTGLKFEGNTKGIIRAIEEMESNIFDRECVKKYYIDHYSKEKNIIMFNDIYNSILLKSERNKL